MTSAEYLYDLRKRLRKLPSQEIDEAMSYYEEYFAEAGPEGEAAVINRLGTPAQVASTIISDYAMKGMGSKDQTQEKSGPLKTMWIVIIAVLASPIAIPLAIALLIVVFCLLIALFSVFLSLAVAALTMVISGLAVIGLSLVAIVSQPLDAIAMMGVSFICVSLGLALGLGTIKLCRLTIKGITWIFARILGKKGGQR